MNPRICFRIALIALILVLIVNSPIGIFLINLLSTTHTAGTVHLG